ncbi:hypothetical protein QTP70_020057 [Hemibagrus guttatus]|uniref:Uncharacterized protein n=1 Tax=Hemibagrus guttatus TaxID=175788 RepID=A0AAE0QKD2_9TELE|nr:hypothetical protein QTP70_020057 [Hemibagrus guttatus]
MKKRTQNMSLIGQKMDSTFVLRRKEVIHSEPSEIVEKWPALFTESQLYDVTCVRTAVLHGLPVLLGDDSEQFFRICFDSDVDTDFSGIDVGLLTVLAEDMSARTSNVLNVDSSRAIILEGRIVMDDAPNLDYPKTMRNTFDFIQRVFLSLGGKNLTPKLQTLKNQLLS